jgi:hypothetical protein
MAVAFLALFLVLGGSAMALRGHNTVKGDDIKNGAVTSADIRNGTVTGRDVRNNTLTGSDVNESKLGEVPRAKAAGTADTATIAGSAGSATTAATARNSDTVGGQTVRTYDFTVATTAVAPHIFSAGGVELSATCAAGVSDDNARNVSGVAAAYQVGYVRGLSTAVGNADEDFTSGDADDVGNAASGSGTASVSFANGTLTTIVFAYQDAGQTGGDCHYWGRVISG